MIKYSRIIALSLILCFSSAFADIERVNVSSSGEQSLGSSIYASISTDSRYVTFASSANNLIAGDTNNVDDVFLHDRLTGLTEIISVSSSGEQGVGFGSYIGGTGDNNISADGRFVGFASRSGNLVEGFFNSSRFGHVYVHDRQTGMTELISVSPSGIPGNNWSGSPSLSADGRYVIFGSSASNLVAGDDNRRSDIFIHDRQTGLTDKFYEFTPSGFVNDSGLYLERRYVAFASEATELVADDTNNWADVFIYDRQTGLIERVSVSSSGEQANRASTNVDSSPDGRFVLFSSVATNLVVGDTNDRQDMFIHDRHTGVTELVSVSSNGQQGNESSTYGSLSADGRYVTFLSDASNLVVGDINGVTDVFIRDRHTGRTELVSISSNGIPGNDSSYSNLISPDGRTVVFSSSADNLVENDTNGSADIFVTDNSLFETEDQLLTIEKRINNETRETLDNVAKLATGTLYRQSYIVTNDSPNRIYQVRVFENGNMVCNFYSLDPGQSRQRCDTFQTVLDGEQHVQVNVRAKVSGSGELLSGSTDAYYTGLNVTGDLHVTHRINNINADTLGQAKSLGSSQASVSYKVENTGEIELYQVKAYHDPVSPVNNGWALQCVLGPLKPGQIRYCKRDINLTDVGLNKSMGRVQGRDAIRNATDVVNTSNPTYFIVP